jgi:hypothetical protein
LSELQVHKNPKRTVLGLPDSSFVTSSSNGFISFLDLAKSKITKRFRCRNVAISKMLAMDENIFTFGDDFGTLFSMDKRIKDALINSSKSLCHDYISSIIETPTEKGVVITSGDGAIAQVDPFQMKTISKNQNPNVEITCATKIDSDGKIIACCTETGIINFFKFSNWSDPFECMKTKSSIVSCCVCDQGSIMFSNSNGKINLLEKGRIKSLVSLPNEFDCILKGPCKDNYYVAQEESLFRFKFPDNSINLFSQID